jgi:hypothetical protein
MRSRPDSCSQPEKHYAPWVKSRQDRLDDLVMATWRHAPAMSFEDARTFLGSVKDVSFKGSLTDSEKSELAKLASRIKEIVGAGAHSPTI